MAGDSLGGLDAGRVWKGDVGISVLGALSLPQSLATEPAWSEGVLRGAQAQFLDPHGYYRIPLCITYAQQEAVAQSHYQLYPCTVGL